MQEFESEAESQDSNQTTKKREPMEMPVKEELESEPEKEAPQGRLRPHAAPRGDASVLKARNDEKKKAMREKK